MKKIITILFFIILTTNIYAFSPNSTYWVQHSIEHKANTENIYKLATLQLDVLLADSSTSAYINQKNYKDLPPAVILDIDDTVLNNSAYTGYQITHNKGFDSNDWFEFTSQAASPIVEGSNKFIKYALKKGVQVFFVSNREARERDSTIKNLKKVGISFKNMSKYILLKKDKPEWGSDKSTRYDEVAKTHRIIMIIGDDFGDFVTTKGLAYNEYSKLYKKYYML